MPICFTSVSANGETLTRNSFDIGHCQPCLLAIQRG